MQSYLGQEHHSGLANPAGRLDVQAANELGFEGWIGAYPWVTTI